jgi:hypothetical protein
VAESVISQQVLPSRYNIKTYAVLHLLIHTSKFMCCVFSHLHCSLSLVLKNIAINLQAISCTHYTLQIFITLYILKYVIMAILNSSYFFDHFPNKTGKCSPLSF